MSHAFEPEANCPLDDVRVLDLFSPWRMCSSGCMARSRR
jgi:hypothetical protein